MSAEASFVALDLGADSGRAISGAFDGERLAITEAHRFRNRPVRVRDSLHWDLLGLYAGIEDGLAAHVAQHGPDVRAIGLDTWGVDFALLAADDTLAGLPYHYRDRRTEGIMEAALERVSREELFGWTGVQFLSINTLYQLLALRRANAASLRSATSLLLMPDLFNFWLSGVKVSEWTIASTTQMCDVRERAWSRQLLEALDLPSDILQPIVAPGAVLGPLLPSVAARVGVTRAGEPVQVVAPACHDTGSAVVAVPATTPRFAYISSGTWSLVGAETRAPVLGPAALRHNFTNEGGVEGTYRLLKNISGLWLLQECRRSWLRAGKVWTYDELIERARSAPPFGPLVDPNCAVFIAPDDMPSAIRERCRETSQAIPTDEGQMVRCTLESLALAYRTTLDELAEVLGAPADVIHVVGGGSQNELLCQFTADACGIQVVAGPVEATAIGNLLVQMSSMGLLGSLAEMREVVRRSVTVRRYAPQEQAAWDEAYGRFKQIVDQADV